MVPSRRDFLNLLRDFGVGLMSFGPLTMLCRCGQKPHITTDRTCSRVLADLHAHAMINQWNRTTPMAKRYPFVESQVSGAVNLFRVNLKHCYEAGVDMICAAHFNVFDEWLSMPTDPNPEASIHTVQMLDQLEQEVNGPLAPYVRLAKDGGDLAVKVNTPKTDPDWRTAVVHTLEGGHCLGGDLSALSTFADRNVAMIGLTHFFNKGIASAANSFPFFPDAGARRPFQGLSGFGREVIGEMERLGMIVDVAHCTSTAMEDVLTCAKRPLVASHMGARTLSSHPYSLLDEHLQEIASRGGIIGIIIDPFLLTNFATADQATAEGSLRDVVRTARYVYKLCGRQHVGIGSDASGFISPPQEMHFLSEIGKLRTLLLREFEDVGIVDDILANNAIKFISENWGRRT